MNGPGIDYSHGTANFDRRTGIHYGIINSDRLADWFLSELEYDYGEPTCYECGSVVEDSRKEKDYWCPNCRIYLWSDDCFPEQPLRSFIEDEDYYIEVDEYGDVWVFKSPYYTHAKFCSPCAPGAGHLGNPCPDGPMTYCLGSDFFRDCLCPYPIYSVQTLEKLA